MDQSVCLKLLSCLVVTTELFDIWVKLIRTDIVTTGNTDRSSEMGPILYGNQCMMATQLTASFQV